MTQPLFAFGDIHGQRAALDAALDRLGPEPEAAPIVFVGDYIDRGPDSAGVVARLMAAQATGAPWICLQGNHDTFLPEFLAGPEPDSEHLWIGLRWMGEGVGGRQTLESYGVDADPRRPVSALLEDARAAVPPDHAEWLRGLPRMHVTDDHVFVHAGIRPRVPLDAQDPEDLIWIRDAFLTDPTDHGRLIVHGHTPGQRVELFPNRLNLDGGAGYGRPLEPVRLLGRAVTVIGCDGDRPL
ncbi:metallophosphoesterase family protein [Citreimonas sp.]|uniref:metallophosphoesterase family protein n=1 Tax=Citreimonas sp. TaxID=3036715 RepID=UPI00405994D9